MTRTMTTEHLNKIQPILSEIITTEDTFIHSLKEFEFFLSCKINTISEKLPKLKDFLAGLIISLRGLSARIEIYNDPALIVKINEKRIEEKDIISFIDLLTKSFSEPVEGVEGEFMKKIPILMLYVTYFQDNQKMLGVLFKDDPEKDINEGTWVNERFILPIQRLPRYKLFLNEMHTQLIKPFRSEEITPDNIEFLIYKLNKLIETVSSRLASINSAAKLLDRDTTGVVTAVKMEIKKAPPPVPASYQSTRGVPTIVKKEDKNNRRISITAPPPIPASLLRSNSILTLNKTPASITSDTRPRAVSDFSKIRERFASPSHFSEPRNLVQLPSKKDKDIEKIAEATSSSNLLSMTVT